MTGKVTDFGIVSILYIFCESLVSPYYHTKNGTTYVTVIKKENDIVIIHYNLATLS